MAVIGYVIVDQKEFLFVGNNLAVDFVNTQVMNEGSVVDLLESKLDMLTWISHAGISFQAEISDADYSEFKQFRTLVKSITDRLLESDAIPTEEEVAAINTYLEEYKQTKQLRIDSQGAVIQDKEHALSSKEVLGLIALSAAQLLVDLSKYVLKKCASDKCVLIFMDVSKAKRRRWCSMELCGNRSKAATHYANSKKAKID